MKSIKEPCYIAFKVGDYIESIYVHTDGGLYTTGEILLVNYKTEEKISKLIGLGSLYRVGKNIGKKVNYFKYINDSNINNDEKLKTAQCVAGHRDYDKPLIIETFCDWEDFEKHIENMPIVYLYDSDVKTWYVKVDLTHNILKSDFKELKKVLN